METDDAYTESVSRVPTMRQYMRTFPQKASEATRLEAASIKDTIARRKAGHNLDAATETKLLGAINILEKLDVKTEQELVEHFSRKGSLYKKIQDSASKIADQTDNAYKFLQTAFGKDSENIAVMTAELLENETYGKFFANSPTTGKEFAKALNSFNMAEREKETEANIDAFLTDIDA